MFGRAVFMLGCADFSLGIVALELGTAASEIGPDTLACGRRLLQRRRHFVPASRTELERNSTEHGINTAVVERHAAELRENRADHQL
jgi:hypothetical protein